MRCGKQPLPNDFGAPQRPSNPQVVVRSTATREREEGL